MLFHKSLLNSIISAFELIKCRIIIKFETNTRYSGVLNEEQKKKFEVFSKIVLKFTLYQGLPKWATTEV